ncbi:MAG: aldose 1-epimerase family protein [Kiritimatiellae bacterium]|nr:aldose 1-epimerase family protein [Kiritimatiellia bacterium]
MSTSSKTFTVPLDEENWILTPVEAGLDGTWLGSIQMRTLHGGRQEGVKVIDVDNGVTTFSVVPTRGMSVHSVHCGDVTLGWESPVTDIVHPAYINLDSRGGLGWLDGFNEWMVRCGTEFAGHPGDDNGHMLNLHGKAGNIPASAVEVVIDNDAPHRIRLRGLVEEKTFKFVNYELLTEVSTTPGEAGLHFSDVLRNLGAYETEYQIIYHTNFGAPLLGENATFLAPFKTVTPFDDYAAKDIGSWTRYLGPTREYGEQVYCVEPYADANNQTLVMLRNADGDRGAAMRFDTTTLPYFTLWKNTDTLEEGYVTGLEPATGFPYNRSIERRFNRVPRIGSGETRSFSMSVSVLSDSAAIKATEAEISALQADRPSQINSVSATPPSD